MEVLESRIAPAAVFVITGASTTIYKNGVAHLATSGEAAAALAATSTGALLLSAGDSLVFESGSYHTPTSADHVLMKVSGGQSMVFLTELPINTSGYDFTDITGLAVSTGFKATVGTDINGPVLTALNASGSFTANAGAVDLQAGSISSLQVAGQINGGGIFAGGNIQNVKVGGPLYNTSTPDASVTSGLSTGSAANALTVSLNGGTDTLMTSFAPGAGASGGNIINVTLVHGANLISTGDGGANLKGNGGTGGNIVNVSDFLVTGSLTVSTGGGGDVTGSGNGGAGGAITSFQASVTTGGNSVSMSTGEGGDSASGNGGSGGGIFLSKVTILDDANNLGVSTGSGGSPGDTLGNGGSSGGISGLNVLGHNLAGTFTVQVGTGEESGQYRGSGGSGGSISNATFTLGNIASGKLFAGVGMEGVTAGGAGGSFSNVAITTGTSKSWQIEAGSAGEANSTGAGGAGGSISNFSLTTGAVDTTVAIGAGIGGESVGGPVGNGGSISNLSFKNTGAVGGSTSIIAGLGGVLGAGGNFSQSTGNGGSISNLTLTNVGGLAGFTIEAGDAGFISEGAGHGGQGGAISNVTINNAAANTAAGLIYSGQGGNPADGSAAGNAGNSGSVSNVTINDTFGASSPFEVYAGSGLDTYMGSSKGGGMNSAGATGKGGSIGTVSNIHLNGPNSTFIVGQANASAGEGYGTHGVGGNGGNISNVTGKVGILDIYAADGGDGNSDLGIAGHGGSVSNVQITSVGSFVQMIAAGNGGYGAVGGAGGSISNVTVAGSIGDFSSPFDVADKSGMGGLVAGLGGESTGGPANALNGGISNVTATQIAAILAGRPDANAITTGNAVTHLSGIHAAAIGASNPANTGTQSEIGTNGGTFYWNGTDSAFTLGAGDTPIDGFVLVDTGGGGLTLPVKPLLLIQV